ncbi:hypothetical protein [Sutcliffiella rhizosphaerae]|uniref:Uncharacterized protein n=1 Tax=Sutcliffiella rhizosphaerae TaxID=2880967 RepID=A0ABN8AEU3_9BACI|nr:hypothetical protein [Sutcliffiella rhizosphaerae]CAG9621723.1 hypothetical protein BACCIP111883_02496 [Sutcliffiella rhizosphaerae]
MKLLWRVIVAIFVLVAAKVAIDSYQMIKVAAGGEHIRIDPALYFNLSYLIFALVGLMFFSDIVQKYLAKRNNQFKY